MGHLGVDGGVASMDTTPFTVMCIDDNVLLVDALERRLNLERGFGGLQRVDDLSRAVDQAARTKPSVVLLDVDLKLEFYRSFVSPRLSSDQINLDHIFTVGRKLARKLGNFTRLG